MTAISVISGVARSVRTTLMAVAAGLMSGLMVVVLGKKSVVVIPGLAAIAAMILVPYSALYSLVAVTPINLEIVGPITVARLVILLGIVATAVQIIRRQIPAPSFMNWPEGFVASMFFIWLAFATVAIGKGDFVTRYGPYIIYAFTFFLVMNYVNTIGRLRTVLMVLVVMGVFEALLGLAEAYFGFKPFGGYAHQLLADAQSTGEIRVTGTNSHPITFAGYFQVVIAVTITLALSATKTSHKVGFLMLIPLFLKTWTLTFSRSSWIGMVVMIFIGMLLMSKITRRLAILGGLVVFVLLFAHDFSPRSVVRALESLGSVDKVQTTAGLSSGSDSLQWRFENWEVAWAIFKDYPFFGIGLDLSVGSVLNYLPLGATAHQYIAPATPHNMFLVVLAEGGIISFILFMLIWVVALASLLRAARKPETRIYAGGVFAILAGLTGTYFFNPMPREIWLVLGLGMAVGRIAKSLPEAPAAPAAQAAPEPSS